MEMSAPRRRTLSPASPSSSCSSSILHQPAARLNTSYESNSNVQSMVANIRYGNMKLERHSKVLQPYLSCFEFSFAQVISSTNMRTLSRISGEKTGIENFVPAFRYLKAPFCFTAIRHLQTFTSWDVDEFISMNNSLISKFMSLLSYLPSFSSCLQFLFGDTCKKQTFY